MKHVVMDIGTILIERDDAKPQCWITVKCNKETSPTVMTAPSEGYARAMVVAIVEYHLCNLTKTVRNSLLCDRDRMLLEDWFKRVLDIPIPSSRWE